MDFSDTPEEAAFRADVQKFLNANATLRKPGDPAQRVRYLEGPEPLRAAKAWQAKKADAGYAGITWDARWGGRGGTPIQQVIYNQEERRYNVPRGFFEIGLFDRFGRVAHDRRSERLERRRKSTGRHGFSRVGGRRRRNRGRNARVDFRRAHRDRAHRGFVVVPGLALGVVLANGVLGLQGIHGQLVFDAKAVLVEHASSAKVRPRALRRATFRQTSPRRRLARS